MFTGTATGVGYLLAGIPNLELMSLVVALAGVVLGVRAGALGGALAAALYSLGSPYGLPVVWLLAAQMLGFAGMGILGGIWRTLSRVHGDTGWRSHLAALVLALVGTAWYEAVTTCAVLLGFGLEPLVVLTGAIPFAMIHLGTNLAIFAALFPPLARRLRHLGPSGLTGRNRLAGLALLATLAVARPAIVDAQEPAAADSVRVVAPVTRGVNGWQRGLWQPFSQSLLERLAWRGNLVPLSDGGLGAAIRILGEVSTSPQPLFTRDGLPLGTGHILADDPALVCIAGMDLEATAFGQDGWGGTGGRMDLHRHDPLPGDGFSSYEGTKGRHETYGRLVQILTPRAPWRFGFEFQENLDKEGYNYTDRPADVFDPVLDTDFPGHARVRQSHARLTRTLADGGSLDVDYDFGRKTKDLLPVLGEDHQEMWASGLAADMQARTGPVGVRAALFWRNRDVYFDPVAVSADTSGRLLNTGLEGLLLEFSLLGPRGQSLPAPVAISAPDSLGDAFADSLADSLAPALSDSLDQTKANPPPAAGAPSGEAGPRTRLSISLTSWTLDDSGPDSAWAGPAAGPVHLDGQDARLVLESGHRIAGLAVQGHGGGLWNNRLGWDGTWGAELSGQWGARWGLFWEKGGRAPRSDEWGTVLRHNVDDRELILEPNPDLKRERTRRMGGKMTGSMLGIDLAMDGSVGRIDDGIAWQPDTADPQRGRWVNGAGLDYRRVTAGVGHEGRFLGWGRIRYEGTWQDYTLNGLPPASLAPEKFGRLTLMWENHFFAEDGILELALIRTHVGAMADPWDPERTAVLPARTLTDLIVGFRLVGADISLAFRNLTGERYRLTTGAWGPGPETVMRLAWRFTR